MMKSKETKLKAGDWVVNEDGIAQVVSMHSTYIEEFSINYLNGSQAIGDLEYELCAYKVLCNFDGKPRKRNIRLVMNAEYCEPVSGEYLALLSNFKVKHPREYARFTDFKSKVPIKRSYHLSFHYRHPDLSGLIESVAAIDSELPKPFVFSDFDKLAKTKKLNLDISRAYADPNIQPADFFLRLYNEDLATRDNKMLFWEVRLTEHDWRNVVKDM